MTTIGDPQTPSPRKVSGDLSQDSSRVCVCVKVERTEEVAGICLSRKQQYPFEEGNCGFMMP